MPSAFKLLSYRIARSLGMFALALRLTRHKPRILAYHGFASGDVLRFRPKLFISPTTFDRHLQILRKWNFNVIELDRLVTDIRQRRQVDRVVSITIDDGFASTLSVAAPILKKFSFPAIVYITTYHARHQTPVFDLVISYIIWKTNHQHLNWQHPSDPTLRSMSLESTDLRIHAAGKIIAYGHELDSESERVALSIALGDVLGVPYDVIESEQTFRLLSRDEIVQIRAVGLNIGLHTHRHRFPADDLQSCRLELQENALFLAGLTGEQPKHFCYPSGEYSTCQWPLLDELGIQSSTTCDTGLIEAGDPPHGLRRFLDGDLVTDIEFEAEICGFSELMRKLMKIHRNPKWQT